MTRLFRLLVAIVLCVHGMIGPARAETGTPGAIAWRDWSDDLFAQAGHEKRLVLLDLGAVWCHWCHVMDETTYEDPVVVSLVSSRFLAVRVDQDARPDLSNRYEDYGWPATIVFDADGHELVKFAGYIPPPRMRSLLQAIIDDPTPGPSVRPEATLVRSGDASLTPSLRDELRELLAGRYDHEHGGWGFEKKFLDWDGVEYGLLGAREGDGDAGRMARETLDAQLRLIDPVWGGVYQYSHGGDWDHPHFEKIMQMQAENLRIYSQAYVYWHDPRYLNAAGDIHRFLRSFLMSPEGAFYVSQDADLVRGRHAGEYFALPDAERRARGIPRVDTHLYTRENGWAALALASLYAASGDESPLKEALRAASWIVERRSLAGGGFRHDELDSAGPYLGDTLSAGRAFLTLYSVTGDRAWLERAEAAASFIAGHFRRDGTPGFVTSQAASGLPTQPQRDENIALARFANLLAQYTGKPEQRSLAEEALAYLAIPEVARRFSTAGVLLVDRELRSVPLHVTVVGPRNDPRAQALLRTAIAAPTAYKRVELWDPKEGPLPRADVEYPTLRTAAAFICGEGRCSPPLLEPASLLARMAESAGTALAENGGPTP